MIYQRKLKQKLWRLQNLYKIKDKQKRIINCKFNTAQWQIISDTIGQKPIRHFSLKSRQVGVTTLWMLYWLDECIFEENVTTGILAHKWESLDLIWDVVEVAYNNFPEKLPLKKESAKTLEFAHNNSKIFISLSIRSVGLHNLHVSEWCWCNDAEVRATLGACSPLTNITGESTGNGVSNDGYEVYQDAKLGISEYKSRFIAWFLDKESIVPLKDPKDADLIMTDLNDEEKNLKKLMQEDYNMVLKPEQVLWRRQKKRSLKSLFQQECPETDMDAFITSGQHFYNLRKALALLKEAREWYKQKEYYEKTDEYICFEQPNRSDVFVAGADTSEGLNDYNALKIINVTRRREAFVYKSKVGFRKFYKVCDEWCRMYNKALLAVEDNNTGHAVLLGLEENCKYPNLYKDTNITRIVKDSKKVKTKLGWHTDKFSRPQMLSDLKTGIEDEEDTTIEEFLPEITFYDLFLLTELFDFIKISGDKYEAAAGKYDDVIFATAIAFQLYLISKKHVHAKKSSQMGVLIGKQREAKG